MTKLIYTAIASLDGYIEDPTGNFDWAMPDEEVHLFINTLERSTGTALYGRRMYETMQVWETDESLASESPLLGEYAGIWKAQEKIVYSHSLTAVSTSKTRIEREFDPGKIRHLKETSNRDISIGGPGLAVHAFRAGLVDECLLFLAPVSVGGGKKALPADARLNLELLEEQRFGSGIVFLRYWVRHP